MLYFFLTHSTYRIPQVASYLSSNLVMDLPTFFLLHLQYLKKQYVPHLRFQQGHKTLTASFHFDWAKGTFEIILVDLGSTLTFAPLSIDFQASVIYLNQQKMLPIFLSFWALEACNY